MKKLLLLSLLLLFSCTEKKNSHSTNADVTKVALEKWQSMKYGMFIHYGLYSVAGGEWKGEKVPYYSEQIMNHARIPIDEYEKLTDGFSAEGWNADSVVALAKENGMKYIVITSKHHDGFNLYNSSVSDYNVVKRTPSGRDIIGELATACKKQGIALGFYYSLPDWHYEKGIERGEIDTITNCSQHVNQIYSPLEHITPELEEYIVKQLTELLTMYGDIITIWFDMGIVTEAQSCRFRDVVKSIQPNCLVSGRLMNNYGDYLTLPDNGNVSGYTSLAWDNPASLYGTWGYRSWCERPELNFQIARQLERLISTVSHGGVFLLNIGPKGDGSVLEYEAEVLKGIGKWLEVNGEAIYETQPSPFIKMPKGVYVTRKDNRLYVINLNVTEVELYGLQNKITKIYSFGSKEEIAYSNSENILKFTPTNDVTVIEIEGEVKTTPEPVYPNADNSFVLTEDNGITHSAFDAYGYITTQANSYKSWNLSNIKAGKYKLIIEYLPQEAATVYSFTYGDSVLSHLLPGVDKMVQTCHIGNIELKSGAMEFKFDRAKRTDALQPLGVRIERIMLIPSQR